MTRRRENNGVSGTSCVDSRHLAPPPAGSIPKLEFGNEGMAGAVGRARIEDRGWRMARNGQTSEIRGRKPGLLAAAKRSFEDIGRSQPGVWERGERGDGGGRMESRACGIARWILAAGRRLFGIARRSGRSTLGLAQYGGFRRGRQKRHAWARALPEARTPQRGVPTIFRAEKFS